MIQTLEKSARTEDEAIALALSELGLDRDDVSVEILTRSKSGFLGIGATNAVIRVTYEVPDPKPAVEEKKAAPEKKPAEERKPKAEKKPEKKPERKPEKMPEAAPVPEAPATAVKAAPSDEPAEFREVRDFLSGLVEKMGVKADIEISAREGGGIDVKLSGPSMGAIIGRRGETLDAIQHLTNYAVNRGSDKRYHINVDAEGYRSKREDSLVKLAEKMAEKAIKYKRSMALEPMNSYERHVIHSALQNYEGVTTASTGTEPNRRVVVSYVKPENSGSNKPQSREWA